VEADLPATAHYVKMVSILFYSTVYESKDCLGNEPVTLQ
jgi:hypothetical protein